MVATEQELAKLRTEALVELKRMIWDFFIETFENSDSFPDGEIEEFFNRVSGELVTRNLAYRTWEQEGRGKQQ